jgi:hypothetical protein
MACLRRGRGRGAAARLGCRQRHKDSPP